MLPLQKRGLWRIARPFSIVAKRLKISQDLELTNSFNKRSHFPICFWDPQFNKQQIFLWSNFGREKKTNQQKKMQQTKRTLFKPKLTLRSKHVSRQHCKDFVQKPHRWALLSTKEEVCKKLGRQKKNKYYPKHPKTCWEGVLGMLLGSKYLLRRFLDV